MSDIQVLVLFNGTGRHELSLDKTSFCALLQAPVLSRRLATRVAHLSTLVELSEQVSHHMAVLWWVARLFCHFAWVLQSINGKGAWNLSGWHHDGRGMLICMLLSGIS